MSKAVISHAEISLSIYKSAIFASYQSPYTKSLGFYIDQHIDWENHINYITEKSAGIAILRETLP